MQSPESMASADTQNLRMMYNVYRVSSIGFPRNHHAIFVETGDDQSGWVFQVTGNIQEGMEHNDQPSDKPEESPTYQSKELIGTITAADFARIKPTCESIPPPKKQFEGPRKLYSKEPLRCCQEWTQEAIDALVKAELVKN